MGKTVDSSKVVFIVVIKLICINIMLHVITYPTQHWNTFVLGRSSDPLRFLSQVFESQLLIFHPHLETVFVPVFEREARVEISSQLSVHSSIDFRAIFLHGMSE